jgi:hypothetical protein
LNWPANHVGWRLQVQTNDVTQGLGTNWVDVVGATVTNQMTLPIDPANGSVFYRMVYPGLKEPWLRLYRNRKNPLAFSRSSLTWRNGLKKNETSCPLRPIRDSFRMENLPAGDDRHYCSVAGGCRWNVEFNVHTAGGFGYRRDVERWHHDEHGRGR